MYIEEFYSLIDEIQLPKEEFDNMRMLIIEAGHQYLLRKYQNKLTDTLEFTIKDYYIEQSERLEKLGILVYPKSWKKRHTEDRGRDFGPSVYFDWTTEEHETHVIFPTNLFKNSKKEKVLEIIKSNTNNSRRA